MLGPLWAIFAGARAGARALWAIFAGAGATVGDFAGARAGAGPLWAIFCRREGWCWGHGRFLPAFSAGDAQALRQLGSRSGRDLLTQSRRDAIKLLPALKRPVDLLAMASHDARATLCDLPVAAVDPGLAARVPGAHGLAGLPPHIGPEARLLLVGEAVGAVRHVVEGETLHEGPAFQHPRLGVFQDPHGRIEVGDDPERAEH